MKAVQFAEYGAPDVMHVAEVEDPHAAAGQVRIAAHAAGVNGIDWKIRSGALRDMMPVDLPAGLGNDAAGVVDEVGTGVTGVSVGDRVFGSGAHAYSQFVVLNHWAVMPDGLSFEEAAGLPIPVETAIRILDEVDVKSGDTIVVNGASGGVGSAVIQIARDRGAQVIGVASAANHDYLRQLGAIPTTYGAGMVERVRQLAPDGIDAALDIAGSGVIRELIDLTGEPSQVLSIADFSAGELGAKVSSQPVGQSAAFAEAARLAAQGQLHLEVQHRFPLEQAAQAHEISQRGHVRGRIILSIA
jgi:NADPH:quinone reductase-like Zn-dependent oxidoreductase